MPKRAQWDPSYTVGHELIDAQHLGLLAQCHLLADDCAADAGPERDQRFDTAFARLKALAREHFEAEASLRAACGDPDLEDHRAEYFEFEYLADEIATTENFDRLELQRFVTLWCVGHIAGSVKALRDLLAGGGAQA